MGALHIILLRHEYSTFDSAARKLSTSAIPADGVMGICRRLGTTFKVKVATIDLLAHTGGLVAGSNTRDSDELKILSGLMSECVYECNLRVLLISDFEKVCLSG